MKIEWFVKTNLMVPVSSHSEDFEIFVKLSSIESIAKAVKAAIDLVNGDNIL